MPPPLHAELLVLVDHLIEFELVLKGGEESIAGHDALDPREIEHVASSEKLSIDLHAAANPIRFGQGGKRLIERVDIGADGDVGALEGAAQDHRLASGQRLADRLEG